MNATQRPHAGTVMIYAINRTEAWWRHVGDHLGFERAVIVSDIRGNGDFPLVDDFYAAYRTRVQSGETQSDLLTSAQVSDVIARCRVLRWLPRKKATAMVLAMAEALDRIVERENLVAIVCFPMDRYVSDVLDRLARARGIPLYELTASALPDMAMLLYRGQLIRHANAPDPAQVEQKVRQIADPLFTPAYVQGTRRFDRWQWAKIFAYFRLRGWAFKAISYLQRHPLALHYLDSQANLGHKPRLNDSQMVDLPDANWQSKIEAFPKEMRVFMALQLFPEASIDYWIPDLGLVDHEDMLVEAARAFSSAGFQILVKDHPLQFGFRQVNLLQRLLEIPNVVVVPYQVSGNAVLNVVGTNFTCTGTLGLQAALLGLKSVATPSYYAQSEDFILFSSRAEIADLPRRVIEAPTPDALHERQARIVANLLAGSFDCNFFTFKGFNPDKPDPDVAALGRALGRELIAFSAEGANWHRRFANFV